jgi:hypothetical protein
MGADVVESPFHGADELASGSQWTLGGGMNSVETNSHRHTNGSICHAWLKGELDACVEFSDTLVKTESGKNGSWTRRDRPWRPFPGCRKFQFHH